MIKPHSSKIVEKINFSSNDGQSHKRDFDDMKNTVNNIGKTRWGNAILNHYYDQGYTVKMEWNPDMKELGKYEANPDTKDLKIEIKNTDDFGTMAHELYESCDGVTTLNTVGDREMGVRMFETILVKREVIGHTSSDRRDLDDAMWNLVNNMAENDWDMNKVDGELWSRACNELKQIGTYDEYGEFHSPYNPSENKTSFNPALLQMMWEEYYIPYDYGYGYGEDDGYGDGIKDGYYGDNENYGYSNNYGDGYDNRYNEGYEDGYNKGYSEGSSGKLDPECECTCPDCKCQNLK